MLREYSRLHKLLYQVVSNNLTIGENSDKLKFGFLSLNLRDIRQQFVSARATVSEQIIRRRGLLKFGAEESLFVMRGILGKKEDSRAIDFGVPSDERQQKNIRNIHSMNKNERGRARDRKPWLRVCDALLRASLVASVQFSLRTTGYDPPSSKNMNRAYLNHFSTEIALTTCKKNNDSTRT